MLQHPRAAGIPRVGQHETTLLVKRAKGSAFFGDSAGHRNLIVCGRINWGCKNMSPLKQSWARKLRDSSTANRVGTDMRYRHDYESTNVDTQSHARRSNPQHLSHHPPRP